MHLSSNSTKTNIESLGKHKNKTKVQMLVVDSDRLSAPYSKLKNRHIDFDVQIIKP
jgi:hypothetical protein